MSAGAVRVLIVTSACLLWLTGCESWNKTAEWLNTPPSAEPAPTTDTTASIPPPPPVTEPLPGVDPATTTGDPNDDLNLGKRHFRENNFGLAERYFRRAVEKGPTEKGRDAEAWLGLAASYDRLRRFELADRAYVEAIKTVGATPEILNNHGYSYMLRGDYVRARAKLKAAYAKDPKNPFIQANLELLEQSARRR